MPAKTTRKKAVRQSKGPVIVIGGRKVTMVGRIRGKHKQPISVLRKIVDMAIAHRKALEGKA